MLEWRQNWYEKTICTKEYSFHVEEELFAADKTDCIAKIFDANYKPDNLKEITATIQQLNSNKQKQLYEC